MDSANSGSLHSSSGGDEEYDSRAAAHSLFITTPSPSQLRPISSALPPPQFDPFSNYIQPHNPNTPWPRPASMRSDPNPSTIDPIIFQAPTAAAAPRNPRKRPRASRRAPTTVLTTDTTNFRAMVQEFTGIPAAPFNSSSFPRSRLDLFSTRSTAFEAPYLRHPLAQKIESPPPYLVSSTASTPLNCQLPITQDSNLFNLQNPNTLTSLLQSNPKYLITSKPHDQDSFGIPTSDDLHHEIDVVPTSLNGLPNLVSPDQIGAQNYHHHHHHHQMKATVSGFSNVATRGEGMVESWICSSE